MAVAQASYDRLEMATWCPVASCRAGMPAWRAGGSCIRLTTNQESYTAYAIGFEDGLWMCLSYMEWLAASYSCDTAEGHAWC